MRDARGWNLAHRRAWKRIWPTLLSAAAQSAIRASNGQHNRSADIHAAIILARTAFDAYLHELIILRRIPAHIRFATGPGATKFLSATRWRLISVAEGSSASKNNKNDYEHIRDLPLDQKLQTLLLLLEVPHSSPLVANFDTQFAALKWLNALRNAIIHRDFGPPAPALIEACKSIRSTLGLRASRPEQPWEELLSYPLIATWACSIVCRALLMLEEIDRNRTIHLAATREAVASAISPMRLEQLQWK